MPTQRDYNILQKDIALTGFFSEYLPPCFTLDEKILHYPPSKSCDLISPATFSMSRFTKGNARRIISLPEIGSYLVTYHYMKNNDIIRELIEFSEKNSHSFSRDIEESGEIIRHDQIYHGVNDKYIENIAQKIIFSSGAKKILKLDISNCFSSFYIHMLPAILLGVEQAYDNFFKYNNGIACSSVYKKYRGLDDVIRRQNLNRTNGLLVGPLFSKIIVEAMLARIDNDLDSNGYHFVRYIDDYEFFLYEDNEKEIISGVEKVLKKYCFTLNSEKIEVIDFPYYLVENFSKIAIRNIMSAEALIDVFGKFISFEQGGVKGAIRYLIKKMQQNKVYIKDEELYKAYLITLMANNERSLINICSLLIDSKIGLSADDECNIKSMLRKHIASGNELEIIWITYLLIQKRAITKNDSIVKEIFEVNNEFISLLLFIYDLLNGNQIDFLKGSSSWILLYELYANAHISEGCFVDKLHLKNNVAMYDQLNKKKIHFIKKIEIDNSRLGKLKANSQDGHMLKVLQNLLESGK